MDASLKILIADDHSLVREGLKLALRELPDNAVVLEASSADEVQTVLAANPDTRLVILDLHMPGVNDMELLSALCNTHPDMPVVVLSAAESPRVMQRAIDRGAAGFIPKSAASQVLISALQLVLAGGVYIPPAMIGKPAADSPETAGPADTAGITPRRSTSVRPAFTGRQIDVLALLSEGDSNKTIARKLGLSEHTIKIHMTAIFKTLGVRNRTEAAIAYRELGLSGVK
jgi:DNA-binding NarL/FixJ family response regulator